MPQGFTNIDFIILGLFFLLIFFVGFKYTNNKKGIVQHFLGGKQSGWFIIGSSLFITTVSSEHVVGYPEAGYIQGFATGNFPWMGSLGLLFLAWFFVPFYIKNQILTTPEFIGRRFGQKSRTIMSVFSIIVYIITKVSIMLFAAALLLEALLGWDKYTSSLILVVLTGIITLAGGFRGELYLHVFHCYILIFCSLIVLIVGIEAVDGLSAFVKIPTSHFRIFEPTDHKDYPWTGMLLGTPILQIWYWCTDQYIVQRVLSARDIPNARRGAIFGGLLLITTPCLLLGPGFIAYVFYDGSSAIEGKVLLSVINDVLPTGVKALAIIAMLSALISSLSSSFHSVATLYALDIYTKLYPNANEFRIVNIGKITTILVITLAIVWVSFIGYFSENIIKNLQTIQSYVAPPFTAIFLVGLLWSRANSYGAFVVLVSGLAIGLFRLFIDFFKDSFLGIDFIMAFLNTNFLHQTFILFVFYVFIMVVVSLCTKKPEHIQLSGLTYKYQNEITYHDNFSKEISQKWKRKDILLSILLVSLIILIWGTLSFSFINI